MLQEAKRSPPSLSGGGAASAPAEPEEDPDEEPEEDPDEEPEEEDPDDEPEDEPDEEPEEDPDEEPEPDAVAHPPSSGFATFPPELPPQAPNAAGANRAASAGTQRNPR
jgi:hypothetical protein